MSKTEIFPRLGKRNEASERDRLEADTGAEIVSQGCGLPIKHSDLARYLWMPQPDIRRPSTLLTSLILQFFSHSGCNEAIASF